MGLAGQQTTSLTSTLSTLGVRNEIQAYLGGDPRWITPSDETINVKYPREDGAMAHYSDYAPITLRNCAPHLAIHLSEELVQSDRKSKLKFIYYHW